MKLKACFEITFRIALAAGFVFFLRTFVVSVQRVDGLSMLPTLNDGDFVFIDKITKRYNPGDIVIFKQREDKLIKRLIAPPNSKIYISDYQLFVDGQPFVESREIQPVWDRDSFACRYSEVYTTDERGFFLMGDNRCNSRDSRAFGGIPKENIIGKIFFKF